MRRTLLVATAFALALLLASCAGLAPSRAGSATASLGADQILTYYHVDGFGAKTETPAWLAWEFEAQSFVRYQVTFTSCTCRQESINVKSLLYLEISKGEKGGKIRRIRYDYWGDSPVMPEGQTRAEIETKFVPLFVNRKSPGIAAIDTIAGATVTTINLKQIVQAVLAYHDRKYPSPGVPDSPDVDALSKASTL